MDIAHDHQPRSIAAGSVMLMSLILDLNISKKNISETFKISQVTIMKTYKKIFPYRKILIDDDTCNNMIKYINIKSKKILDDLSNSDNTDSDKSSNINQNISLINRYVT